METAALQELYERTELPEDLRALTTEMVTLIEADPEILAFYKTCEDGLFTGRRTYPDIVNFAEARGLDTGMLVFAFNVLESERAHVLYREQLGAPDEIFYDSMRDLLIWAEVYRRKNGRWGMPDQYEWLATLLRGSVIRIGRLEYEHPCRFRRSFRYERRGVVLAHRTPVIGIHIPEGGPLTEEIRLDSYRRAYRFFQCEGLQPFICDSWLLYPRHREFLPPTSNILSFMSDFDIIESHDCDDHGDLWRVFGQLDSFAPETLPRRTGLQRAYADWLAKGNRMGDAFGVFLFDGEQIVR